MKFITLFTAAIALAVAASAYAGDVAPFYYAKDRVGKQDWVMGATLYVNEVVAGPLASVSATCPNEAKYIKFDPGVVGDFRTKANGSGTPGTSAVTDGTGWRNNVAELQPINDLVSDTTVTSYAVYSAVASNTVPYACYGK